MDEIVAGVSHHCELFRRHHAIQTKGQLGAADAAGQREIMIAHRNRSSSLGRTRADAGVSGAVLVKPRITTTGQPSSA